MKQPSPRQLALSEVIYQILYVVVKQVEIQSSRKFQLWGGFWQL
jgi:hypothetical protein